MSDKIKLLAFDGEKKDERQGELGVALHDKTKWAIRKGVDIAWWKYKKVDEYKRTNGWLKPHVKVLDECWQWTTDLYKLPYAKKFFGYMEDDDKNRIMLQRMGRMGLGIQDEDTFWDLFMLAFLYKVHLEWPRIDNAAKAAYRFLNFDRVYQDYIELNKELPEVTEEDEKFYGDKNGMDIDGKRESKDNSK